MLFYDSNIIPINRRYTHLNIKHYTIKGALVHTCLDTLIFEKNLKKRSDEILWLWYSQLLFPIAAVFGLILLCICISHKIFENYTDKIRHVMLTSFTVLSCKALIANTGVGCRSYSRNTRSVHTRIWITFIDVYRNMISSICYSNVCTYISHVYILFYHGLCKLEFKRFHFYTIPYSAPLL